MSDIVERLRACHGIRSDDPECCCQEAADKIERLTRERDNLQAGVVVAIARVERLIAALEQKG